MGPEVWIAIVAIFISGGAIGALGTLMAQWILRGAAPPPPGLTRNERDLLRDEVADLHKHIRNMDARLDFTERLLDGGLPLSPPPERMPAPEPREAAEDVEDTTRTSGAVSDAETDGDESPNGTGKTAPSEP
ncbi:MAG: hypothetical protein R3304_02565 [Longimicrobiales bacterium]|nr:hypothetical protein [Longimicrobiales bacterium]